MTAMFRRTLTAAEAPAAEAEARRKYETDHIDKLGRPPSTEDCDRWWPTTASRDMGNVA